MEEPLATRRWASSSDLISEQEKERSSISFSPISDTGDKRFGSPQSVQIADSSFTQRRFTTPKHGRTTPTSDCSRVRVLNPDYGVDPRKVSSPITLYPSDLEFLDEQRTLRRNSYRNAMCEGDGDICQNGHRNGKQPNTPYNSEVRSRTQSFGPVTTERTIKSDYKRDYERSSSLGNFNEASELNEMESDLRINRTSTPIATDQSLSLSSRLPSSRPSSPRPSSLAIIDTIVNHNDEPVCSPSSSPTSTPQFVRKRYSPRLLRVKTSTFPLQKVTRSSSETSSSSSESSWSNRNSIRRDNSTNSIPNGLRAQTLPISSSAVHVQRSRDSRCVEFI